MTRKTSVGIPLEQIPEERTPCNTTFQHRPGKEPMVEQPMEESASSLMMRFHCRNLDRGSDSRTSTITWNVMFQGWLKPIGRISKSLGRCRCSSTFQEGLCKTKRKYCCALGTTNCCKAGPTSSTWLRLGSRPI